MPDKTRVDTGCLPADHQSRYNATDLGTSGVAFPGMYFGNAMQKAAEAHNQQTEVNIKSAQMVRIAVVDNFDSKTIDIDGDNIPDLSHGEVVERYLKAENPNVQINRFEVAIDLATGNIENASLVQALEQVKKQMDSGEKFDAVNMSLAYEVDLSNQGSVTSASIGEAESELRAYLFDENNSLTADQQELKDRIEAIEKITAGDVPVYIAAGNEGRNNYNTLGLAHGTVQVGALNAYGDTLYARNSDVKQYEQGEYIVGPTFEGDSDIVSGYDINEDGVKDVDTSEVSGHGKLELYPTITGTSFSTPTALSKKTR
jgi:hypothetical protein